MDTFFGTLGPVAALAALLASSYGAWRAWQNRNRTLGVDQRGPEDVPVERNEFLVTISQRTQPSQPKDFHAS